MRFVTAYAIEWGPLAAASVIGIIPSAALIAFMQKYLVRGLTFGTVRGQQPPPLDSRKGKGELVITDHFISMSIAYDNSALALISSHGCGLFVSCMRLRGSMNVAEKYGKHVNATSRVKKPEVLIGAKRPPSKIPGKTALDEFSGRSVVIRILQTWSRGRYSTPD